MRVKFRLHRGRMNNSISLFVAFVSLMDEIKHDLLMSDASHTTHTDCPEISNCFIAAHVATKLPK